jgi:hypothetical protein
MGWTPPEGEREHSSFAPTGITLEGQERNRFLTAPPPFFSIPSWWRRFLFRILPPRDLTIYAYICSLCGPEATAFPTHDQIAYEMGLNSTDGVIKALGRLEDCGLLMRELKTLPGRQTATRRTVYQRPSPEFTLLRLIEKGDIDENLFPKGKHDESLIDEQDTTAAAVSAGLKSLLTKRYPAVSSASSENRKEALWSALHAQLQERTGKTYVDLRAVLKLKNRYSETSADVALEVDLPVSIKNLSKVQIAILNAMLANAFLPSSAVIAYDVKYDTERAGFTKAGFNIGIKGLIGKNFIATTEVYNNGSMCEALQITSTGWEWIEQNSSEFHLVNQNEENGEDEEFEMN